MLIPCVYPDQHVILFLTGVFMISWLNLPQLLALEMLNRYVMYVQVSLSDPYGSTMQRQGTGGKGWRRDEEGVIWNRDQGGSVWRQEEGVEGTF